MMKTSVLDFLDQGLWRQEPQRPWVRDRGLNWTLDAFSELSHRIGSALAGMGIGPFSVVGVFLPNSAWILAADFGIMRAGGAFMNLDVTVPAERLQGLLANVKPAVMVTDADHLELLRSIFDGPIHLIGELAEHAITAGILDARRREATDADPACLITTSGSTGVPKAVALPHRGLIDFGEWFDRTFDFSGSDVVGSLSPLFFDGYIPGLLMSLYHGGQFVILPKESASFPAVLVEHLRTEKISFIFWVPSTLTPIANFRLLDTATLPDLRFVGFAGEVMPPLPLAYLRRALPQARFVNFYGPIEVSVICTYFEVPADFPDDLPVPIGHACGNSSVLLLNERDEPCAPGEHGELCARGSCVALGYWNDPERTAERFARNPLVANYPEIIYRTGDVAYRDEAGVIHFIGRRDFQIKHQGYRIDLAEIEHVLGVTAGIRSLCILYDAKKKQIIAVYDDDRTLTLGDLRKSISDKLPKYMYPHVLHKHSPMPLNPNGKIDRNRLAKQYIPAEPVSAAVAAADAAG